MGKRVLICFMPIRVLHRLKAIDLPAAPQYWWEQYCKKTPSLNLRWEVLSFTSLRARAVDSFHL